MNVGGKSVIKVKCPECNKEMIECYDDFNSYFECKDCMLYFDLKGNEIRWN